MTAPYRTLDEVMSQLPLERQEKIHSRAKQTLASMQLSHLRKHQGISQQQLADRLHVSQSAISQLENQGDLQFDTLYRYVSALGGQLRIEVDMPDGSRVALLD